MTVTVQLTAQQTAERLIPILKDYADKFLSINERSNRIIMGLGSTEYHITNVSLDMARLICLCDAIAKSSLVVGQSASGLLEHSELEHVTWIELKLRLDEFEEHVRFSKITIDRLLKYLKQFPYLDTLRKEIEQGRYKAPF